MLLRFLAVLVLCETALSAQEKERSLQKIGIALDRPPAIVMGTMPAIPDYSLRLGPFRQMPPQKRGEVIRLSLPVGEYVATAFEKIGAAKRRRDQAAARRAVEAALREFNEQHRKD